MQHIVHPTIFTGASDIGLGIALAADDGVTSLRPST
ncbi:MAG: hypothetical protein K0R60_972 [Microbacterium sp.]|nr:hypothetical protein [Microbacterium sp.]